MIKKISSILTLTLAFAFLVSTTAFADDSNTSTSSSNSSGTVTSSTYGNATVTSNTYGNGSLDQIDALYSQLILLRQQEQDLNVQMKTQHDLNASAIKAIQSQLNPDDLSLIKSVSDKNKALLTNNKDLFNQYKNLGIELNNARKMKDEKLVVELRLQLSVVRNQIKPIRDQIDANNASIKDVVQRVNAARKQIKAALDPIKPLEQQMRTLWSNVSAINAQKNQEWKVFNDAVNNGDIGAAASSLSQIVNDKQQIISIKQQIYSLQQQVGTTLNVGGSASK